MKKCIECNLGIHNHIEKTIFQKMRNYWFLEKMCINNCNCSIRSLVSYSFDFIKRVGESLFASFVTIQIRKNTDLLSIWTKNNFVECAEFTLLVLISYRIKLIGNYLCIPDRAADVVFISLTNDQENSPKDQLSLMIHLLN